MDLASDLAREFMAARYPQHLPSFIEYVKLSALDVEIEESLEGAKQFAHLELIEEMIGPFVLSVISGYIGNLLFHYFGPARSSRTTALTDNDCEALRRSLKDPKKKARATQRTSNDYGHKELVEEIVQFVEKRLEAGDNDEHPRSIREEGEHKSADQKHAHQISQSGEGNSDPEAGLAESKRMRRGDTSGAQ